MHAGISKVIPIRHIKSAKTFLFFLASWLILCNNNDQTLFFIGLTFPRSLGGWGRGGGGGDVENLCLWPSASVSTAVSEPGKCKIVKPCFIHLLNISYN